ncbi:MAG: hypothetical protein ACD_54C00956G0002 [uncultured bacterium]|nr:MAG: hypothetical protein ACD_54C00956G0002 [uncultured bacterium]
MPSIPREMQAFITSHSRAMPLSISARLRNFNSFASFICAMLCPDAFAISSISAAVSNG